MEEEDFCQCKDPVKGQGLKGLFTEEKPISVDFCKICGLEIK